MRTFASPEELAAFVAQTEAALREAGMADAAARFGDVRGTAFTSSSEWLGELGLAVKAIRKRAGLVGPLRERLDCILAAIRQAQRRR